MAYAFQCDQCGKVFTTKPVVLTIEIDVGEAMKRRRVRITVGNPGSDYLSELCAECLRSILAECFQRFSKVAVN